MLFNPIVFCCSFSVVSQKSLKFRKSFPIICVTYSRQLVARAPEWTLFEYQTYYLPDVKGTWKYIYLVVKTIRCLPNPKQVSKPWKEIVCSLSELGILKILDNVFVVHSIVLVCLYDDPAMPCCRREHLSYLGGYYFKQWNASYCPMAVSCAVIVAVYAAYVTYKIVILVWLWCFFFVKK